MMRIATVDVPGEHTTVRTNETIEWRGFHIVVALAGNPASSSRAANLFMRCRVVQITPGTTACPCLVQETGRFVDKRSRNTSCIRLFDAPLRNNEGTIRQSGIRNGQSSGPKYTGRGASFYLPSRLLVRRFHDVTHAWGPDPQKNSIHGAPHLLTCASLGGDLRTLTQS